MQRRNQRYSHFPNDAQPPRDDEALAVAREHVAWCRAQRPLRMWPEMIFLALNGVRWSGRRRPTWNDATDELARAWRRMRS